MQAAAKNVDLSFISMITFNAIYVLNHCPDACFAAINHIAIIAKQATTSKIIDALNVSILRVVLSVQGIKAAQSVNWVIIFIMVNVSNVVLQLKVVHPVCQVINV